MINLIALMLMGGLNVAEAHPPHRHHKPRIAQRHFSRPPTPPPSAIGHHRVIQYKNHWIYPHSNVKYVWKWTSGHYNRRGKWVPGHWSVILRF